MAKGKGGGSKIGRSAKSGKFTSVSKAKANKGTHVVETIKRKR